MLCIKYYPCFQNNSTPRRFTNAEVKTFTYNNLFFMLVPFMYNVFNVCVCVCVCV
jgi:hypothetical protein